MPWELKHVEDMRRELVEAFQAGQSMARLCRLHGISRKTGYKWVARCANEGPENGLKDQSRAPHKPARLFADHQIERLIELKQQKRDWGPKKLIARLRERHPDELWPCCMRAHQILKQYGLVRPRRHRSRVPATHPLGEVNDSNDVWMADFKGWFLTGDGQKCEPFTITDGSTRYLLRCSHLPGKSVDYVWPAIADVFLEYGLPKRFRTDNGPPFGSTGVGRLTPLSIKLIKAGVVPEWINPGHPEENGRHERFHRTLKQAVASPPADSLKEQMLRMLAFQEEYNYDRPHEALGQQPPGRHYYASTRQWDGILRAPEYDTQEMEVRKVGQNGSIWLNGQEYYIGSTLTGEHVGLKDGDHGVEVHYGPVYLAELRGGGDVVKPKLKPKKIVRRM